MDVAEAGERLSSTGEEVYAKISQMSTIDPDGDICLCIENKSSHSPYRYRVASKALRQASDYFNNLLDPSRFIEGIRLSHSLDRQLSMKQTLKEVELPIINVKDVELPLVLSSSSHDVLSHFLARVHGFDPPGDLLKRSFLFVFSLAIVADRFLSRQYIHQDISSTCQSKTWSRRQNDRLMLEKRTPEVETMWRQRILLGIWYRLDDWVAIFTHLLIIHGSRGWFELSEERHTNGHPLSPMWDELPEELEDELYLRRQRILSCISSLQDFVVGEYASAERQCRLGYDTSPQCDIFQLGQALRFLNRKELLSLRCTLQGYEQREESGSSLIEICDILKALPSYQLDNNHAHCGARKLLLPRVEYVQTLIMNRSYVAVCMRCWRRKTRFSWAQSNKAWKFDNRAALRRLANICDDHSPARIGVFLAHEWDWSSSN